jgi:hypothetical protein
VHPPIPPTNTHAAPNISFSSDPVDSGDNLMSLVKQLAFADFACVTARKPSRSEQPHFDIFMRTIHNKEISVRSILSRR